MQCACLWVYAMSHTKGCCCFASQAGFDAETGKAAWWEPQYLFDKSSPLIKRTSKKCVPACADTRCHECNVFVVLLHLQDLMQQMAKQHGGSLGTSLIKAVPSSKERPRGLCLLPGACNEQNLGEKKYM